MGKPIWPSICRNEFTVRHNGARDPPSHPTEFLHVTRFGEPQRIDEIFWPCCISSLDSSNSGSHWRSGSPRKVCCRPVPRGRCKERDGGISDRRRGQSRREREKGHAGEVMPVALEGLRPDTSGPGGPPGEDRSHPIIPDRIDGRKPRGQGLSPAAGWRHFAAEAGRLRISVRHMRCRRWNVNFLTDSDVVLSPSFSMMSRPARTSNRSSESGW